MSRCATERFARASIIVREKNCSFAEFNFLEKEEREAKRKIVIIQEDNHGFS